MRRLASVVLAAALLVLAGAAAGQEEYAPPEARISVDPVPPGPAEVALLRGVLVLMAAGVVSLLGGPLLLGTRPAAARWGARVALAGGVLGIATWLLPALPPPIGEGHAGNALFARVLLAASLALVLGGLSLHMRADRILSGRRGKGRRAPA